MDFSPEFEDEFKELQFALENTERGGWFFAVYQQWKVAEELIARIKKATTLPVFAWQYSQDKPSYPVDYLHNLTAEQKTQRAMVMLFHVASGGEKVIKSLDFNRERFADYPHSLLFWVTESELKQIAIGAGHFWAQRGGRFDFSQVFIPDNNATNMQYSKWDGLLLHVENYQEAKKQLVFYLAELEQRKNETDMLALAELYDKIACLFYFLGKYSEAIFYGEKVLAIRKQILGEENLQVANSLNNLAWLYSRQERNEDALLFFQLSLTIRKQLGQNHSDVAKTLNNLALLYINQKHYSEASLIYQYSLAIWNKQLGANHLEIATALNNLAELYHYQGECEKALPLYRKALAIRKKQLGENHPWVAASLSNLANFYNTQGRYLEALPLYQRALAILEKTLGTEHPHTKKVAENYARLQAKIANVETPS